MRSTRKRPTIGLLVDRLEDYYQNTILWTVEQVAIENDCNLLCFPGGVLKSPDRFAIERNVIFDLVGSHNVDGILILSGTVGNEIGSEQLADFCGRYQNLPITSIAVDLKGIPSVTTDNQTGMREAIDHLISVHGRRRIAFIRGPETNDDAQERYDVYQEVLTRNNLEFNPALVANGEWEPSLAKEAVDRFVAAGNRAFDAIVSASDAMAVAAVERLRDLDIRVPQDVAVVSFDDDEEARLCTPPLTTVRQPLIQQVRRATLVLIDQIHGKPVYGNEIIHTELVIRQSCGCERSATTFGNESEKNALIDSLIQAERRQARERLQAEQWARMLSDTGEALLTSFDTDSLGKALFRQLPGLSIETCFLSLYLPDEPNTVKLARSRLTLAYRDGGQILIPADREVFSSQDLVPDELLPERRYSFVVLPLFFEQRQMGFALFEIGPRVGNIYEALRDQLSAALQGASLMKRVVETEQERRNLVQYILDVTPTMHRLQPLQKTAESILAQLSHVLRSGTQTGESPQGDADAFLALRDDETDLILIAGTGSFANQQELDTCIDPDTMNRVHETLRTGLIHATHDEVIIPMRVGELPLGVVYVTGPGISIWQADLVTLLTNQATVALQNIRLYEMATLDPLTGVHARRYFDRWILRELRAAFRAHLPLSLIMMDVDGLKGINDKGGHLVGDQALSTMGKVLRKATRTEDIVGRYGGDEFAIVLPNTQMNGAELLAKRIIKLLHAENGIGPSGEFLLRSSIGIATLTPPEFSGDQLRRSFTREYFADVINTLIQSADEMLYRSKHEGRNRYTTGVPLTWPEPPEEEKRPD